MGKKCSGCKTEQCVTSFSIHKDCVGGRNTFCKRCVDRRRRKGPGNGKGALLKRYWPGNTAVECWDLFNRLLKGQRGLCKICNLPEREIHYRTNGVRYLCVDHDKTTGIVRGLLCSQCNSGIGKLKHSPSLLENAKKYLNDFGVK